MRKLKVTELNRLTPEAFKNSEKIPLIVVLDHVRSLNNVGSVFRTSDAFRVESINPQDGFGSGRFGGLEVFQRYAGSC